MLLSPLWTVLVGGPALVGSVAPAVALSPAAAAPAAAVSAAQEARLDEVQALVEVTLDLVASPNLIDVRRLGLDLAWYEPASGTAWLLVDAADQATLAEEGWSVRVLHEDLAEFYARRAAEPAATFTGTPSLGAWLNPTFGSGGMAGMYTWPEVESVLNQIAAAYPEIVEGPFSIGQTLEGREILAVKLSDNPDVDENEPEIRFDSMHHSREPMSMQTTLWYLLWCVENYGSDPLATYLVDERESWFIPVVNPDGYEYNRQTNPNGGGLWRKNRRNNGDGTFGVDLNRNYPFQWGYDNFGSSPVTSDETYRGPSPASEPETQVMVSFIDGRDFSTALSSHSFSNVYLHPWGYDFNPSPDVAAYDEINPLLVEDNGYEIGQASFVLYPANGNTFDYDSSSNGTLGWTPEIGAQSDGFWPDPSRILPLVEENLLAFQRTALVGGAFLRVQGESQIEVGDGDGILEAGEGVDLIVSLRNSGRQSTSGNVQVSLSSSSPQAVASVANVSIGAVGSFQSADNAAQPLRLDIAPGTPDGTAIPYTLAVTYEGYTQVSEGLLAVGPRRGLVFDDLEVDLGWERSAPGDDATTGLWELGNPNGTTSNGGSPVNPEDDLTPGGTDAFVTGNGGGSAGNDDIDDGVTTLTTPALDLEGAGLVFVSFGRWFVNLTALDDQLQIDVRPDAGQSWTPLTTITGNQGEWIVDEFLLNDFVTPGPGTQLRFRASDTGTGSLVEAAIDDLRVEVVSPGPRLGVFGNAGPGDPVQLGLAAAPGAVYVTYFGASAPPVAIPGVDGLLELDPLSAQVLLNGVVPASGQATQLLTLPNDGGLSGATVGLQTLVIELPDTVRLSNGTTFTID
ncbi:MAG: M14 family zinc carboxypeptidase [Planctomycetota bacterium]|jgi:hypothetical protein